MKASDLLVKPASVATVFDLSTEDRVAYWRWLRDVFPEHTDNGHSWVYQRWISSAARKYFDEPERKYVVDLHNQTKPEHEQKNTESDQHHNDSPFLLFSSYYGTALAGEK